MAKKTLVFNEVARKGLEAGVNKLAECCKSNTRSKKVET